jgi:hypothetical protein
MGDSYFLSLTFKNSIFTFSFGLTKELAGTIFFYFKDINSSSKFVSTACDRSQESVPVSTVIVLLKKNLSFISHLLMAHTIHKLNLV